jgi:RNA polymerase sigma-70 factor (family 1)
MEQSILMIKAGDSASFLQAYHDYHSRLYQYILRYTQSEYLAEETVQITFIKLWEKRENLSEEYRLSTQLFRMAINIVIDLLRKESIRNISAQKGRAYPDTAQVTIPVAERDELERTLRNIEFLPPVRKNVFKLSRFGGLSHKEVASALNVSPKTVEAHISKAIKQLRNSLLLLV